MLRVRPFSAVRPAAGLAAQVSSVPYDVCDRSEALALSEGLPMSFLHVVRPEIDLPADTDAYADIVYETARRNLERMMADGTLIRDDAPSMYVYRQRMQLDGAVLEQTGVVGCCHVDDYRGGVIKKHETTRKKKEDDRTRHVLTLGAHTGPVFILHQDAPDIAARVKASTLQAPLYDFVAPDGVHHTVWHALDGCDLANAYAALPTAYVADGHHRSASAERAAAERASASSVSDDDAEYNWFLAVLFPASELHILPYHRYIGDLGEHSPAEFITALKVIAEVRPVTGPEGTEAGSFGMFIQGGWHRVDWHDTDGRDDPVKDLEYVRLFERVLLPLLGIQDVRTDPRIDFVGGIRGAGELERRVNDGGGVAFQMPAVTVQQLMDVSDSGSIMPPKSTWFEPKLRSGLLVHLLD